MKEMWRQGGAKEEDPTPYLKTVLCRVVSVAVVTHRINTQGEVFIQLFSLPKKIADPELVREKNIVATFLEALGKWHPCLVGYNSLAADLRILIQRGIVHGLHVPEFCKRPGKPWEAADYFVKGNDWNIDLKDVVTPGWGHGSPSLHEIATLSGIPGKMDISGDQVPQLWLQGKLDQIVAYNECDALTTYLLWLRVAYFSGHLSEVVYLAAQEALRQLLQREAKESGKNHLLSYLNEWDRLRSAVLE
ncbi:MAG: hypothetical protein HQL58_07285 [Magnetococcales bacterium]|nr:hypothetical protein [Magnetococcales bacterium]